MSVNVNGLRIGITKILYYISYGNSRGYGYEDLHIAFNDGSKTLIINTQEASKYKKELDEAIENYYEIEGETK